MLQLRQRITSTTLCRERAMSSALKDFKDAQKPREPGKQSSKLTSMETETRDEGGYEVRGGTEESRKAARRANSSPK